MTAARLLLLLAAAAGAAAQCRQYARYDLVALAPTITASSGGAATAEQLASLTARRPEAPHATTAATGGALQFVQFDFGGSPVEVGAVDIGADPSLVALTNGRLLQHSDDASSWSTAATLSGLPGGVRVTLADAVTARYWRLAAPAVDEAVHVGRIHFYAPPAVPAVLTSSLATPVMTKSSQWSASPGVGGGWETLASLTDGDMETGVTTHITLNSWVQVDFGEAVSVCSIDVGSINSPNWGTPYSDNRDVQYRVDDASPWITLFRVSGTGTSTLSLNFDTNLPATARYFRITNAVDTWIGIGTLEFYSPVPCGPEDGPGTPQLDAVASGISDGDLRVVFDASPNTRYESPAVFRFVGGTDACDSDGAGAALWNYDAAGVSVPDCAATHTLTVPVTTALKECGFSAEPEDGGDTWYYEAVVEATTEEPNGTVFGEDTTRTVTTAFRVRVELPKSVDVSASAVAYGDVIQFALLSRQEVDTSTPTAAFTWTLVTSVQYPYELVAKEVTEETAHDFESLGLSLSAASVACPATGACTQTFEIAATESTSCELTDAELKSVFTIGCRSQFTGACDTPEGVETDTATFTVSTDSFCARVVEVATVTPTLTTSTSQGGASAADFVLQTTLFGRVTFAIEAGLSVTSTRLLSLDLVSEESVKPVTGAGVQDSAVVSAISFVESDQAGTAPHLDFQFQLNTDSVKFAVGGGQASLTITAVVEVTYDGAGSQRLEVSTEAVSGPGSVSTAASSTVGISTPAAGGSSSTAGSTVLGVSTGTAMVAGVGLVAVVALAAGAAVVARKRRSSPSPVKAVQHSSSSASIQLDIAPAGAATTPAIATGDLANVQAAYDASQ